MQTKSPLALMEPDSPSLIKLDGRTAFEFTGPESLVHGHPLSSYSLTLKEKHKIK
jgi:hypothetical protein